MFMLWVSVQFPALRRELHRKTRNGLVTRVVLDLVEPFTGFDHVLYFYSSIELALELIKRGMSIVHTIKAYL